MDLPSQSRPGKGKGGRSLTAAFPLPTTDDGLPTAHRFRSMNLTNSLRGSAPRTRSATSPFLNRMKVGIEVTWYFMATTEDSSTLILATRILSLYWVARSSTIGPTERQGPHQGAQKS